MRYASILSTIVITGGMVCGQAVAAPYAELPAGAPPSTSARVITRAHTPVDFGFGTRLEGTRVYVSGARGSLGVGLLLGPLGVAGNAAHVAKVNRSRGEQLGALVQTDLVSALQAVRQAGGATDAAADVPAYDLLPSVNARFEGETQFHVGCLIQASFKTGKKEWRVRYSVEMPGTYDSASAESVAAATQTVTPCLTEANRLFTAHIAGGMRPGPVQPATLLGVPQKQAFVAEEYPERLIVPDKLGLSEYAASPAKAD